MEETEIVKIDVRHSSYFGLAFTLEDGTEAHLGLSSTCYSSTLHKYLRIYNSTYKIDLRDFNEILEMVQEDNLFKAILKMISVQAWRTRNRNFNNLMWVIEHTNESLKRHHAAQTMKSVYYTMIQYISFDTVEYCMKQCRKINECVGKIRDNIELGEEGEKWAEKLENLDIRIIAKALKPA